ncbi:MAG: type II/IV secretion system protein [Patescibacteria group bacterium]|nr:type II/IV secretion system protein [Patescibacteria group bacterium]
MHVEEGQLKEFLLDSGLVSRAQIEDASKRGRENEVLGEALVSTGAISEDDLRRVEAAVLGIPFVNLEREHIDPDILSLIPEPIARAHNIVAFRKDGESLQVAMLDTDDLAAIDFIRKKTKLKILPRLTGSESMRSALVQYQKSLKQEFGDIIAREAQALSPSGGGHELGEEELKRAAEHLPIVRIVDALLRHAIIQGASDIHIEPQEKELLVRYRIDGILRDAMRLPKAASDGITARIKVLSSLRLDEKRLPQDGRFKVENEGDRVSIRVSILPTAFGEKIVLRLLPEGRRGLTLEWLGLHGQGLEAVHDALKQTIGMILATGPTGSGKTTMLYTMLDILNTPNVNISTIEDPIEYQMPRVNQTQVRPDIGFSFANGLRTLMRQDPDIIMVGEIRDKETTNLAINAALTGHLVLSTLHTNSASGAIARLLDMDAEPFLLVSTLRVLIGERLVRQLCREREEYKPTQRELEELGKIADLPKVLAALKEEKIVDKKATWRDISFWRPKKSAECEDGYRGRIGIHEIMRVSPAIKELIGKRASTDEIETQARKEGMLTMAEDGVFKAVQGITSIEEVMRVISE